VLLERIHLACDVRALLVIASSVLAGCASTSFHPRIEITGGEWRDAYPFEEAASNMTAAVASGVAVLVATLPDGVKRDGPTLVVDTARYRLLARVSAEPNDGGAAFFGLWWYEYNDDESWRTPYCAWQVPLSWLTLTLWSQLPVHYPCKVGVSDAPEAVGKRKQRIVDTMKRATKALGGDLLIIESFGGLETAQTRTGATVTIGSALRGDGFALKRL
jgi:hypothetical protein